MAYSFISIEKFIETPYSTILGYPKATNRQLRSRIVELDKLGIKSLSLTGSTIIGGLSILGKGHVGLVVLGKRNNKQVVALKIRRSDSQRKSMLNEARLLKLANQINVGPRLYDRSKNFLVMEYVNGIKISDWISSLKVTGSSKKLKDVIRDILVDCHKLDMIGLDHGELSNISKHVLVTKTGIVLIDFESSSTKRRPSNVTSSTQAIFIKSKIAKKCEKIYTKPIITKNIINVLRKYKHEISRPNFGNLLNVLKI